MRPERLRRAFWHFRQGGLAQWKEHRRRERAAAATNVPSWFGFRVSEEKQVRQELDIPSWPVPEAFHPRHKVRVGVILDDFSRLAFQYEWDQLVLESDQWRKQLEAAPIDMLFVESAWNGNRGSWQYQLAGDNAPSASLQELAAYCRELSIPTVFWNKEDPAHFDDFIDTAGLFDWVYSTDVQLLEKYKERLGHDRVGVLPFAAQPSIHNPIRPRGLTEDKLLDVAFAGTYFAHKYPERSAQMQMLLGGALDVESRLSHGGLDIYSRFADVDERYQFPEPYKSRVVGEVSYEQMLTLYRAYRVFLNVNSVVTSPSMCARRLFEITACGTPVLSAPSPAIPKFFEPGTVFQADSRKQAEYTVRALCGSAELRDQSTHRGQMHIWGNHTYAHRVNAVLSDVGCDDRLYRLPSVTALLSTNRPHQLVSAAKTMATQQGVDLQVAILTHGFEPSAEQKSQVEDLLANVIWVVGDASIPLGGCYNQLVDVADGDVVAKVDDDDIYQPQYLFEMLNALEFSGAQIAGKGAHFIRLEDTETTVLRFPQLENRFTHFVSGPTITAWRDVAKAHPFPLTTTGEDTGFLKSVSEDSGLIYSASRFEFMQVRSGAGSHTWDIDDMEIMATGIVQPQDVRSA